MDLFGFICNLLALLQFLRFSNSALHLRSREKKEELLTTNQVSSAKRHGLHDVELERSFTYISKKKRSQNRALRNTYVINLEEE